MRYTLWLHDRLVGETAFEHAGPAPKQRLGMLQPTAHGREILPQLCGFLGAAAALQEQMQRGGLMTEQQQIERMPDAIANSTEGDRLLGIVKRLAELEVHAPDGTSLTIRSIAITDLRELAALASRLGSENDIASVATEVDGSPRYLISATIEQGFHRRTLPLPRLTSRH